MADPRDRSSLYVDCRCWLGLELEPVERGGVIVEREIFEHQNGRGRQRESATPTEFEKWASADASATESEKWASGSWKQTWQVGKRATSNDSWKVSKDEARLTPRVQENTSSSSTDTHWRSSAAWKKGDKWTAGAKWIEKKQSDTTPTVVPARIDLDALD